MIHSSLLRSSALGLLILMTEALPGMTETIQMQPQDYAPAAQRNTVPGDLYEVLASPELGVVFAASVPDFADGMPGDVYMLDGDTLAIQRRIQLQRRPFALAADPARGWIYAGNTKDGSLAVIDAKSGMFLRQIQLGQPGAKGKMEHTRMIEVDPATGRVFVTGPTDEGIVWIVDGPRGEILHRLDNVARWAAGLAFDGKDRVFVGGGGDQEIVVLDADTGQKVTSFSTGDTAPGAEESVHFMVNLSIDVTGGRLFAVDSHQGKLYVFDTTSGAILAQIPIGPAALDVIYNPGRNEAYVTYFGTTPEDRSGSGGLVVVDAAQYSVTRDLAVPTFPGNLSLDAAGQTLFVSVGEPPSDQHPNHMPGALASVLRLDLNVLGGLPR